jgi:hypothetical protein
MSFSRGEEINRLPAGLQADLLNELAAGCSQRPHSLLPLPYRLIDTGSEDVQIWFFV